MRGLLAAFDRLQKVSTSASVSKVCPSRDHFKDEVGILNDSACAQIGGAVNRCFYFLVSTPPKVWNMRGYP